MTFKYTGDLTGGSLMVRESRIISELLLKNADQALWKDAIEHQKNGLICDGNSLDEIYSSINDLLNNKKYLEYGKIAKENSTKFYWDKIIEKYKKILN